MLTADSQMTRDDANSSRLLNRAALALAGYGTFILVFWYVYHKMSADEGGLRYTLLGTQLKLQHLSGGARYCDRKTRTLNSISVDR